MVKIRPLREMEEVKIGESEHGTGSIVDSVLDKADGSCAGSTERVGKQNTQA